MMIAELTIWQWIGTGCWLVAMGIPLGMWGYAQVEKRRLRRMAAESRARVQARAALQKELSEISGSVGEPSGKQCATGPGDAGDCCSPAVAPLRRFLRGSPGLESARDERGTGVPEVGGPTGTGANSTRGGGF